MRATITHMKGLQYALPNAELQKLRQFTLLELFQSAAS